MFKRLWNHPPAYSARNLQQNEHMFNSKKL